jgi:hypothetical protein
LGGDHFQVSVKHVCTSFGFSLLENGAGALFKISTGDPRSMSMSQDDLSVLQVLQPSWRELQCRRRRRLPYLFPL